MHGRREAGGPSRGRVLGVFAIGAGVACASALLLATTPAQAEASKTTATLTLTGVRDSNCPVSTGGTTVRVAPNGTVTFKADLAGISVRIPISTILGTTYVTVPLNSGTVASFNDKLVIDGHTKYPHYVSGTKSYVLKNVAKGTHKLAWSANSVQLLSSPLVPGGATVALNANTVVPSSLPAGGELDWVGTLNATSASAKCGISAEIPGAKATLGPIKATLHPVVLPTLTTPKLPSLPKLPGVPGLPGSSTGANGTGSGVNYTQPPLTVPERVVPHPGGGGSAYGGGSGSSAGAQPGSGAPGVPVSGSTTATTAAAAGKSTAAAKSQPAKTVSLSNKQAAGPQLPVLLTVLAVLALSLVTAAYARMYLQRRRS